MQDTLKTATAKVISEQMRKLALMRKGNSSDIVRKGWITRRANIAQKIKAGEIKVP